MFPRHYSVQVHLQQRKHLDKLEGCADDHDRGRGAAGHPASFLD